MPDLKVFGLKKNYIEGQKLIRVLKNIDLELQQGESLAISGTSGSGKSTLLHLLGGLDTATEGTITYDDKNIEEMTEDERAHFRAHHISYIFQFHHLFPDFSAEENVMIPLMIQKRSQSEAQQKAKQLLDRVGLGQRGKHFPHELSGGEQQRVALARALVAEPQVLLADEPTGSLDPETASQVFDLLLELNDEIKSSLIMVSHDKDLVSRLSKQVQLIDGQLQH